MRSESLATTIVTAAASTASPASCPPIRRGSSGSDDAVDVALVIFRFSRRAVPVGVGLGVTTGNRFEMLPGVTVVPGSPGTAGGIEAPMPVGTGGGAELAWLSTVETTASAGDSVSPDGDLAAPWTTTVRLIGSPGVAFLRMWSVTSNSSAWYAGSDPIEQVALWSAGHNVNTGSSMAWPLREMVAVTCRELMVLQTQIE